MLFAMVVDRRRTWIIDGTTRPGKIALDVLSASVLREAGLRMTLTSSVAIAYVRRNGGVRSTRARGPSGSRTTTSGTSIHGAAASTMTGTDAGRAIIQRRGATPTVARFSQASLPSARATRISTSARRGHG